jgi:acetyl-CoA C-acetyltransferase
MGTSDSLPDTRNQLFAPAEQRSEERSQAGAPTWHDPRIDGELPDVYLTMGQTAENLAQYRNVTRQEMDEFALRSQLRYEKVRSMGSGPATSLRSPCPTGPSSTATTPHGGARPRRHWPR